MNKKMIAVAVGWFFLVLFVVLSLGGCSTPRTIDEVIPDSELHDLLHTGKNYAYKSITIKDIIVEDECNGKG